MAAAVEAELGFWQPREGVEVLITGVGPVEASCALAAVLSNPKYELVVNAGIAGTVDGAAEIGDGIVVDHDTIDLALESGEPLALPQGVTLADHAASDSVLVAQLRARGFAALRGITVTRVTATETTADRMRACGAQVESMEGFAVLRAAARAGVRAVELRGISNRCGDRASSNWDFAAGVAGLRRILNTFFELPAVEEILR